MRARKDIATSEIFLHPAICASLDLKLNKVPKGFKF